MKELYLEEIGTAIIFENEGICVVNTTPHPITMMDTSGNIVNVPTTVLINAKSEEKQVSKFLITTEFVQTEDGLETIEKIKSAYAKTNHTEELIIVGSIIAAQAYKGDIVAMTPCKGYERVAPSEKRMNCNKFTVFC